MRVHLSCLPWTRRAIADSRSKAIGVSAGLGSGKTHGAWQWHLTRCFQNRKAPFSAFLEPTYGQIGDTAIPTFRKVAEEMGLREGKHYTIVNSPPPKILLHVTGQEIHLRSADKPQALIGVEYSHGTIDEAGDCKPLAFKNLRSRIRDSRAPFRQVLVIGSPQGINWFAESFDSEANPGWEEVGTREWINKDKSYRRFRLRTNDNPFVPDDYVEELRAAYEYNSAFIKSYVEGIFSPLYEGNAVSEFREDDHLLTLTPDAALPLYLSFDFNALPLAWVTAQIYTIEDEFGREKRYGINGEASDTNRTLLDALAEFARKYPIDAWRETPIFVYGDRSGHAASHKSANTDYDVIRRELQRLGYRVEIRARRAVIGEVESIECLNRLLSYRKAFIDPSLNHSIRSVQSGRWKEGTRKLDKPAGEVISHWLDALKYLLFELEEEQALATNKVRRGLAI